MKEINLLQHLSILYYLSFDVYVYDYLNLEQLFLHVFKHERCFAELELELLFIQKPEFFALSRVRFKNNRT